MNKEEAHKILCRNILPCLIGEWREAISIATKALEAEPHWIPVTDGLPNIREDVLISYYDEVMAGWLNDDETWFAEGFGRLNMNDIAAWQPLPEPYRR